MVVEKGTPSYTPPASLVPFESDLDLLPLHYTPKGSVVALRRELSPTEINYFEWLYGGLLPVEIISQTSFLADNYIISPWGFAPNMSHQLKQLSSGKIFDSTWNGEWRDFLSRKTAVEFLKRRAHLLEHLDFNPPFLPTLVGSMEELNQLTSQGDFVVKSLWSSSGRGVFISKDCKLTRNELNMIVSYFRQGHQVVVEPYFNKVEDFSIQFMVNSTQNVTYKAVTLFETDSRGRYVGSLVGADIEAFYNKYIDAFCGLSLFDFAKCVGEGVKQLLSDHPNNPFAIVENNATERPIGVDMMVYRNSEGKLRIHPCIEINWRYTMGYVAHRLSERLSNGLHGRLVVGQIPNWVERCKTATNLYDYDSEPFTKAGFYPLSRWVGDVQFGAYAEVMD